jgi:hypothetical protein
MGISPIDGRHPYSQSYQQAAAVAPATYRAQPFAGQGEANAWKLPATPQLAGGISPTLTAVALFPPGLVSPQDFGRKNEEFNPFAFGNAAASKSTIQGLGRREESFSSFSALG